MEFSHRGDRVNPKTDRRRTQTWRDLTCNVGRQEPGVRFRSRLIRSRRGEIPAGRVVRPNILESVGGRIFCSDIPARPDSVKCFPCRREYYCRSGWLRYSSDVVRWKIDSDDVLDFE